MPAAKNPELEKLAATIDRDEQTRAVQIRAVLKKQQPPERRTSMTRTALAILLLSASAAVPLPGQFKPPIAAEPAMTSQPEVPGAAAVYLKRFESTDDQLHVFSIYARIKVLTDRG